MSETKDQEQTRERMLRRALELFTELGYEGASIGMIASGMGLTKAAVTYHFRTKEDLLNAVVEPAFTDLNAYFEKWEPGPLKPARRRAAIADYVALLVKYRALLAFLAKEGDRRDPEPVMRQWPRVREQFTQLICGDEEDLSERLYLAAATRGLAIAPVGFPEVADDELREHLQVAAERLLARPRRRTT
ncbi:TetR/AcrR family transcriptional regulator [Streptomyces sp. NPDC001107]